MGDSVELAHLMPNLRMQADKRGAVDALALRQYLKVLADKHHNVPPGVGAPPPPRPRREELPMRPGTGRVPVKRNFIIRLKPEDAEAEEARLAAEAAALDPEEVKDALLLQALAARRATLMATLRPGSGRTPTRRSFRIVLPALVPEPEPEPEPELVAAVQQAGPLGAPTPGTSRRAQLPRTPGSALKWTPMEGVPERLARIAAPGAAPSSYPTLSLPLGTPAGMTPQEGVPERVQHIRVAPGQWLPRGPTPVASSQPLGSDGSPVNGLVQHAMRHPGQHTPAPAHAAFEFSVPAAQREQQAAPEAEAAPEPQAEAGPTEEAGGAFDDVGYDNGGGDCGDDYGDGIYGNDYAGPSDEPEAVAPGTEAAASPAGPEPAGISQQQVEGEPSGPQPPQPHRKAKPSARRGSRLRNELRRKSMATDPTIGRHEVAPGVRRSCRSHEEPLRWWLNESKNFSRAEHMTMPTIVSITHKTPNTPWRMVSDPCPRRSKPERLLLARGPAAAPGEPPEEVGAGAEQEAAPASDDEATVSERPGPGGAVADEGEEEAEAHERPGPGGAADEGEAEAQSHGEAASGPKRRATEATPAQRQRKARQ